MQPMRIEDLVLDPERWEAERGARLAAILAYRQVRRVTLGELVTLDFEDRPTVAWQVNEVLRTEVITDVRRIEAKPGEPLPAAGPRTRSGEAREVRRPAGTGSPGLPAVSRTVVTGTPGTRRAGRPGCRLGATRKVL